MATGEGTSATPNASMRVLVMQESPCKSVWAYAVQSNGGSQDWAVQQICDDLETVGLKNDRIVVKSD